MLVKLPLFVKEYCSMLPLLLERPVPVIILPPVAPSMVPVFCKSAVIVPLLVNTPLLDTLDKLISPLLMTYPVTSMRPSPLTSLSFVPAVQLRTPSLKISVVAIKSEALETNTPLVPILIVSWEILPWLLTLL